MNSNIKKNRLILAIITISLVGLIGIGMSYAYWRFTTIQDKNNVGVSECFSIELANQANEINLTNAYPITDAEGRKLTPYTFTLKNTCSMSAKYNLNMEMLKGTTLNSGYVAVLVNNKDIRLLSSYDAATTVIDGSTESRTLDIGLLEGNSSKDYSISLWIDEDVTLEDDILNKVFKSKIVVDAIATEKSALDVAVDVARDKIIASVDTTGKCPTINSDGTVAVSEEESTDGYLCTAPDAYGDSYYYRGNVTNNYVKFGKWSDNVEPLSYQNPDGDLFPSLAACEQISGVGTCTVITNAGKDMYWRIIRINGDGTVRVIYDGTSAHAIGESSWDRQIGESAFNDYWKKDNVQEVAKSYVSNDNAGVGYMYGNRDAIVETSYTYDDYYSRIKFTNTSTYYIAKEYTFDESTKKFTLKDPIAVLGSAMTSDYVGYYTFGSTSQDISENSLYKILEVTAGSSSASLAYKKVMYGTSSKEVAQTNTNDSTIKTYLDNWYKANISGTENEQYLADNIFCNDRSLSISGGPVSVTNNFYSVRRLSSSVASLGAGATETSYNFYDSTQGKHDLRCPQQNDAFTVNDTKIGNGALRYPIGLINATEVELAGGTSFSNNREYYLYSGGGYWTLTPDAFSSYGAYVMGVYANYSDYDDFEAYKTSGVRPVINLKAEILAQGSGTAADPYHLSS